MTQGEILKVTEYTHVVSYLFKQTIYLRRHPKDLALLLSRQQLSLRFGENLRKVK